MKYRFFLLLLILPVIAAAQTTPPTCPNLSALLKEGNRDNASSSSEVRALQLFLSTMGTSTHQPITGYFGPITKSNVITFQTRHSLARSGVVDASTSAAIGTLCQESEAPTQSTASSTMTTSTQATSTAPASTPPGATLDHDPFISLSASPVLYGSETNLRGPLSLSIFEKSGAAQYQNPDISYANGSWSVTVFPPIADGTYSVQLSSGTTTLSTSTLRIGLRSFPTFVSVPLPPYDVSDGKLIRFGIQAANTGAVEIAQLNFSTATTAAELSNISLYGFTDTAYSRPILDATTTPLNSSSTDPGAGTFSLIPDTPVEIPAGQTYYFELDGSVTPDDASSASITTILLGDPVPSSYETEFSVASTSNIAWSPETFSTSTPSDFDWLNGTYMLGLPPEGVGVTRTSPPNMSPPACTLVSTPASTTLGQPFTLSWTSTNATAAKWSTGTTDVVSGSKSMSGISSTQSYTITFFGQYGATNCAVVVPVVKTASSTQTTQIADSFTASPTSGKVTLAVTFKASLNNASSCNALTYTLVYGDGSNNSTLTVPKSTCKPVSQTLTHSYTKTGTFAAKLYSGVYSPTNPGGSTLLQTQTITVSNTAGTFDPLAQTAGASIAVVRAQLSVILEELARLLGR